MDLVETVGSRLTVVVRAVLGFQRVERLAALERPAPAAAAVAQAEVATPLTVLAVSLAPLAAAAVLAAAQELVD